MIFYSLKKNNFLYLFERIGFIFIYTIFIIGFQLKAQNYRVPRAYIEDFGRNELYIKKALMDYSSSVVETNLDKRKDIAMNRIVEKLKEINATLNKNDKGFKGNTHLRDNFIMMNIMTIETIKTGLLVFNNYDSISKKNLNDIEKEFDKREMVIKEYFSQILKYEAAKRDFGLQYNITVKYYDKKNIFEYSAFQNLLFYKINVIENKLTNSIISKNKTEFIECYKRMELLYNEVVEKTNMYNGYFNDKILNKATIDYMKFIKDKNTFLVKEFSYFLKNQNRLEALKLKLMSDNNNENLNLEYKNFVKKYNKEKNLFFNNLNEFQRVKKLLHQSWHVSKDNFLKNNIQFDNIYSSFIKN